MTLLITALTTFALGGHLHLPLSALPLSASTLDPPHRATAIIGARASLDAQVDLQVELDEAKAAYVRGLEELAEWCQSEKAYAERNAALRGVLHYQPDHKEARRSLRYRFDRKADAWVRRGSFRAPKEGPAEARAIYFERRAALDSAHVDAILDVLHDLDAFGDVLGAVQTYAELRDLQEVTSNVPRLLERLGYVAQESEDGETKGGEAQWVTGLSLETPKRRAALMEKLGAARDSAEDLKEEPLDALEEGLDVDWKNSLRSGRLRVVARAGKEESRKALRAAATAVRWLADVVGQPKEADQDWTLYLLTGRSDMNRFVASYPDLDEDQRRRARLLGSLWLPGKTRCGVWGADEATRIDMSCKQVAVRFLDTQFGVEAKRGWLVDSLGLYVNQNVVGTRISRHVTITEYEKPGEVPLTQGLEDPDADWLAIAHRCLGAFTDAEFARALGRNTNEMTAQDVVVGYALVAYLCEGAGPGGLTHVLEQVGSDAMSSVAALESWFELPLPEIKRRFRDWLGDVAKTEAAPAESE